jgi:hypothetical protein
MERSWKQADVFPIIAHIIEQAYRENQEFVKAQAIAIRLLHVSVEIRDGAERRLVTCIEVLSPTNKRGPGREEYASKRFQIVSGTTPAEATRVEEQLRRTGRRR